MTIEIGDAPVRTHSMKCSTSVCKRLLRGDVRRPHVARPISYPELMSVFGRRIQRDALVVDLDLFGRLEIVIDDHLLAAADESLAYLDGRKPIDADMGDAFAFKEQRDVRHVFRRARYMA